MFTGIITAQGRVREITPRGGDLRFVLEAEALLAQGEAGVEGESIAINGVCLTAVDWQGGVFAADVSTETLQATTLGTLAAGDTVNLERALRAADRLGGHLVSGHVDGVAQVLSRREDARSWRFELGVAPELARYIARKGSVCLDGVSLTVNDVEGPRFGVNIIPHTAQVTTIGGWVEGRAVNLEVDLVARYLESLTMEGANAHA